MSNSTFKITSGPTRAVEHNLILNPGFENGLNNWTASGASFDSLCNDPDRVRSGNRSLRAQFSGALLYGPTTGIHVLTDDIYTFSFKVKYANGDTPSTYSPTFYYGTGGIGTRIYCNTRALDDGWYLAWNMFTGTVAGDTLSISFNSGATVFIDEVRLAIGSNAIEYFDGDTDFCTWDGTPNASASRRESAESSEFEFANLDHRLDGFFLDGITPMVASYRGGGVYNQGAFTDGRRLIDTQYDNVIETINLKLVAQSQDVIAQKMQDLRRLLIKAKDYWINGFATQPVWIEARSSTETNKRYAVVHNAQITSDADLWRQPFLQVGCNSFMDNITLVVERGHWQDAPPGGRDDVLITSYFTAAGPSGDITYGTIDTSGDSSPTKEVHVFNGRIEPNISHVFKYDSALASYSANLQMALPSEYPLNLFETSAVTGDALYFGIESAGNADAVRFTNIVVDIDTPAIWNSASMVWQEYYGGSWQTLTVVDNTQEGTNGPFTRCGPNSIAFILSNSTVAHDPGMGVTGYWVRLLYTSSKALTQVPTQQNRRFYTATKPYIEIPSDQIGGDIDAPIKLSVIPKYDGINRILCCARSVNRGANFSPVINLAQSNNNESITVTVPGALTSFSTASPNLQAANEAAFYHIVAAGPAAWLEQVKVSIATPLAREYSGRFRLLLRFMAYAHNGSNYVDADFTIGAKISNGSGGALFGTPGRFDYDNTELNITEFVADLGVFDLAQLEESDQIDISIYISSVGGYLFMYMSDMWMMPVDEFVVDSKDLVLSSTSEASVGDKIVIDGTKIKKGIESYAMSNSRIRARYNTSSSARPSVKPNSNIRLYFLNFWAGNYDVMESSYWSLTAVRLERVQQYLSMRGNR